MIGIDAFPRFVAVHIFLELVHIKAQRAGVRFKQFPRIRRFAPRRLFAVERIVHLPKLSLETGGFRGERGFSSVFVGGEGKVSKNHAQPRIVFS